MLINKIEGPFSIIPGKGAWKLLSNPSKAFLYTSLYKENLLTGERTSFHYEGLFDELSLDEKKENSLVHFSYEFGHLLNSNKALLKEDDWLAIEFDYKDCDSFVYKEGEQDKLSLGAPFCPSFEEYKEAYIKGYSHLERGDCYQFNLTFPFSFELLFQKDEREYFKDICLKLFEKEENRGGYAHASFIPSKSWGFISNSPECLFDWKGNYVETRPIKGTRSFKEGDSIDEVWKSLSESEKDQAELYMIVDLLKNDLNKIGKPVARVEKLKEKLLVPGLLHQYAQISLEQEKELSVSKIVNSLFPGGSVTGAPKKRVMEILNKLEKRSRGFYCGSTLHWVGEKKVRASINIRSAEAFLKEKKLVYSAGGGITLLSDMQKEYEEMLHKVDSFSLVLQ